MASSPARSFARSRLNTPEDSAPDPGRPPMSYAAARAQRMLTTRVNARAPLDTQSANGRQLTVSAVSARSRVPVTVTHQQQSSLPHDVHLKTLPLHLNTRHSYPLAGGSQPENLDFPENPLRCIGADGVIARQASNDTWQATAPGDDAPGSGVQFSPSRLPLISPRVIPQPQVPGPGGPGSPVIVHQAQATQATPSASIRYQSIGLSPHSGPEIGLRPLASSPVPQRTEPKGQSYIFVPEDPSTKTPTAEELRRRQLPYHDEYIRKQRQEDRDRKEKMKGIGGSCVWCSQMKKACDLEKVCQPCKRKSLPCLRAPEQLWLYANPLNDQSTPISGNRLSALQRAKQEAFAQANRLLNRLKSNVSDRKLVGQAVFELRWRYPNNSWSIALDAELLKSPANGHTLPKDQMDALLEVARKLVPIPELAGLDSTERKAALMTAALQMSRLLGFLVSVTRAEIFGWLGDIALARLALAYFITGVVKTMCQLSEEFAMELLRKLRQKETRTGPLRAIYLATGVYYQVLFGLHQFRPGSMIADILSDVISRLQDVTELVGLLMRTDYLAQRPIHANQAQSSETKELRFWELFNELVPPVPALDGCQLGFYSFNQNSAVPTAMGRLFHLFGTRSSLTVSQLLSSDADHSLWLPLSGLSVPGPSNIKFPPHITGVGRDDSEIVPESCCSPNVACLNPWFDSMFLGDLLDAPFPDELHLDKDSDMQLEHPSLRTSERVTMVPTESDTPTVVGSTRMSYNHGSPTHVGEEVRSSDPLDLFDFDRFQRDQDARCARAKRGKSHGSSSGSEKTIRPLAKRPMLEPAVSSVCLI
ncbi:hypothetical protein VTO42DRAFT_1968 [Malbranchea cinnamomea]